MWWRGDSATYEVGSVRVSFQSGALRLIEIPRVRETDYGKVCFNWLCSNLRISPSNGLDFGKTEHDTEVRCVWVVTAGEERSMGPLSSIFHRVVFGDWHCLNRVIECMQFCYLCFEFVLLSWFISLPLKLHVASLNSKCVSVILTWTN